MRFAVKDMDGKVFDFDAPEGMGIGEIASYATEKLGFKVKAVEHVDDTEERVRQASEAARGESKAEIEGHRGRVAQLEEEIASLREELKDARRESSEALADERSRHEETRKTRAKAYDVIANGLLDNVQRLLTDERAAREAAEKRNADKPVIVENHLPATEMKGWKFSITSRDANGFTRTWEAVPK